MTVLCLPLSDIFEDEALQMVKAQLADRYYLLLLGLGPAFWLAYYIYLPPQPFQWSWPLSDPLRFGVLVVVYPVLEEIVFRGLLLDWLSKQLHQRLGWLTLANVLTSLAFAALHLIHQSLLWSLLIFFPSLVFGFSKERYRSLWAPILLHCWYNLGFLWLFRPT